MKYTKIFENTDEASRATEVLSAYRTDVTRAAGSLQAKATEYLERGRRDLHDQLMLAIDFQHLPSHVVRDLRDKLPIGASFAVAMAMTNAFVRAMKRTDAKGTLRITSKEHGRRLAKRLGLQVAERYQERVPLDSVELAPNCVVKPVYGSGSRGVLIHSSRDGLVHVRDGQRFDSLADYKQLMRRWLGSSQLREDAWIVEEFLTGPDGTPATDMKFYAFYGTVGLTLECRRHPETRYCFYRGSEPVDTGKYPPEKTFRGSGPDPLWLNEIAQVSARIPLPFIRIDMYATGRGLYFGEFTTVPGKYQSFDLEYDRMLGELWNQARADIFADMLRAKTFPEFAELCGDE